MKIQSLHLGMSVRHPQYGLGVVKGITEKAAEIRFDDGVRIVDPELGGLEPGEAQVSIQGLQIPLAQLLRDTVSALADEMGIEKPDAFVSELGVRWHKGKMVLHPSDPTLQTKEIPLEVFFHKLVGIRNQMRVLEQKINSHPGLADGEKVEFQQYVTRCYGSLTTFNVLFRGKESQFSSKSE